ncbi:MAG: asparaginase [Anaerolineales bacterium]|nr:asparaginase [Anaerolineales bacterium]
MSGDYGSLLGYHYQPIFELTRGRIVESIHFGAAAVVDSTGRLLAWYGEPSAVAFMRSSAKPLQALPLIERGGDNVFHLTSKEIAIICGSHDGMDEHVAVVQGIQAKVGVQESDLLCGVHPSYHVLTAEAIKARGEVPTPNRHNCSGKHTGMLAHARMRGLPIADYTNPEQPIQQTILETISEMCGISKTQVEIGIDGCSAPNFAMPLYNAALGFAHLCDPRGLSVERSTACRRITSAMMAHPDMIGGPGRFDTRLMEVCSGRVISKGGAEGYLLMGIMAGALGADSPGVGIALKIADGDLPVRKPDGTTYTRVRPAVGLELLKQLGAISDKELEALAEFGPRKPVTNWRKLVVGESRPAFTLEREKEAQPA